MKPGWKSYAAGLGLLCVVGAPFAFDQERKDLAVESSRSIAGRFVRLSGGRTRYDLLGPAPSQVVVFVHGFTSPAYVWGELPRRLREHGYQTLVYDLFGRGFSDRPEVVYDRDLYDRQLLDLLVHLQLRQPVHLVGLSMGAIIATEFTLRHKPRVASLTLIDPAGFVAEVPGAASMLSVPWLGGYLMRVFGDSLLVAGNAKAVHDQSLVPTLQACFRPQLTYIGYKRAILSTLRSMPLADFTSGYRQLAKRQVPVQVFWGKQDRITPVAGAALARKILPKARMKLIDDAGHLAHYEKPEVVTPVLLGFLGAAPAPEQRGRDVSKASAASRAAKPAPPRSKPKAPSAQVESLPPSPPREAKSPVVRGESN